MDHNDISDSEAGNGPAVKAEAGPGPAKRIMILSVISIAFLALIALAAATSVYTVPSGHRAVVYRLGALSGTVGPGLHARLPVGIDEAAIVDTERIETETFGYRVEKPGIRAGLRKDQASSKEASMITEDLGILEVRWVVQYRRSDPVRYLKGFHDPVQAIRDLSEAAMRSVVGDSGMDEVLDDSSEVAGKSRELLQDQLDRYASGIAVVDVKIKDLAPPDAAAGSFLEVSRAGQEKERLINDALAAYNREIPKARGEAEALVSRAQGYALERVNTAHGEVSRFRDILGEYRGAREVTRKRLYLEACREIIPRAKRIIVLDSRHKGIMPSIELETPLPREGGRK
jgi:membrane protease subunit HflK